VEKTLMTNPVFSTQRVTAKPRRAPNASMAAQHYNLMTNQFLTDEPNN